MSETADRYLTLLFGAAVFGLIILNWKGSNAILGTVGSTSVNLVKAIQGRG